MKASERWLVTGATGLIGGAVCAAAGALRAPPQILRLSRRGAHSSLGHDLADPGSLPALLDELAPDRIIHLAAVARPDRVDRDQRLARQVNVAATATLAEWCRARGRPLIFTSTDQVFDGTKGAPYLEHDAPRPVTAYGAMKLQAEAAVLAAGGGVARMGWVLNDLTFGRPDFLRTALERLAKGESVQAVDDEQRTTITVSAAASALLTLTEEGFAGIVHLAGGEHVTPFQLIAAAARQRGLSTATLEPVSRQTLSPPGRPGDVRLATARNLAASPASARSAHA